MHASSSCSTSGGGEDGVCCEEGKLGEEGEGGMELRASELRFSVLRGGKEAGGRSDIALICRAKNVVINGVAIVTMAVSGSTVGL